MSDFYCEHCAAKGDLSRCMTTACGLKETWFGKELQAIVDKLPKTADGFPLVDGDEIYAVVGKQTRQGVYSLLGCYVSAEGYDGEPCINTKDGKYVATLDRSGFGIPCSNPFHTREAAEAARRKDHGN